MSAAAILVAGNRQLTGKTRVLLLFVVVVAAIVAAVPLIAVHDNPYAMRGYAREVFSAVIGGLVVFFAGLYGMLRRRQLRFEPARATLADVRSFLGDEKVERTPLRDLERVALEIVRSEKTGKTSYYNARLRGPRDRMIDLGDFFERADAVAAGTRAAAITGLPLDEEREDGGIVRLRAEQLSGLPAAAAEEEEQPWWRWPSAIALLLANLIPVAGVLWWGWRVQSLMILFWMENVMVGLYTALRIAMSRESGSVGGAFLFLLHYGLFTAGHGLFVFTFFGRAHLPGSFFWAAAALAASHGVAFYTNHLRSREYEDADVGSLALKCYGRMIALHVSIVAGGSLVVALGQPLVPLMILVGVKIFIDLAGHITEHRAPRIAAYVELAEAHGELQVPPEVSKLAAPEHKAVNPDARPLSHYLGGWRLAAGTSAPPGWFASIELRESAGKVGVRLLSQPGAGGAESVEGTRVSGTAAAIDWIEVRLRSPGRQRILRFAPSQVAGAGGLELTEVQQPEGDSRAAQMRSFSLARA